MRLLLCIVTIIFIGPILFGLSADALQSRADPSQEGQEESPSASDQAEGDPVLGSRIAEALDLDGKLWLRGTAALIFLDLARETRQVAFDRGVIDMQEIGGRLRVLRSPAAGEFKVILSTLSGDAFEDVAELETPKEDFPSILLDVHGGPALLSPHSIRTFDRPTGSWSRKVLNGEIREGVQISIASPLNSRNVYIGYNLGEWGGGLQKLNVETGKITSIQHIDGNDDSWNGPLLSSSAQITDLTPDPDNPQCIIASVGLVHLFMSRGRIVRVCGDEVSLVFEKRYKEDPIEQTEAIFDLAMTPDGLWAVSWRALYLIDDGRISREYVVSDLKFETVSGIRLNRDISGVIILVTDVNWSVSTSGYTPLIVPVH